MRNDTVKFSKLNTALAKRPRYVIEVAFDSASTVLRYFTSHSDCASPDVGATIYGVIEGISGTSQKLNPDLANAIIGNIEFKLVDVASIITATLGGQLVLGRSTRRQRVRVYVGFEGLVWSDYTLVQTQLVTEISYLDGAYSFTCSDIQREMRQDVFTLASTFLSSSVLVGDATINVISTAGFEPVAHGTSYSDAPGQSVYYLKIQNEIIRATGKTSISFTGCTRGALNTREEEHAVDLTQSVDRRTAVDEYVYLELPAIKLIYAMLTGELYGQAASLPTQWHLGIDTSYVRLADFIDATKVDLWDPADDQEGFVVRLEGLEKQDGKKFVETELALLCGTFMPVYSDGALGLKRMANVLAGAAYSKMLDKTNLVSVGELIHDFTALHNVLQVNWNWEESSREFTRINLLIDQDSITVHQKADPMKYKFRGLHGSRHSSVILAQRFDTIRDRYTGPPLRVQVSALPSLNVMEVGDVVRLRPEGTRDFVVSGGGDLDRSFEIQNVAIDWVTGAVTFELFASSQAPGAIALSADTHVLTDAWYVSEGTDLASVLTIAGTNPGHVTASGTLTGTADLNAAGSIFYFNGDLVIDPGVTINIVNNVQLRIKGFLQNNGSFNGVGNGIAGATAVAVPANDTDYNSGTAGFLGITEAGGGWSLSGLLGAVMIRGGIVTAPNAVVPGFNIDWDGAILSGRPGDLRGSSGSSGMTITSIIGGFSNMPLPVGGILPAFQYPGGAGGNGGAGLEIVCRGLAQGVAGKINLSGADGLAVARHSWIPFENVAGGSGAGGAPGGLLVLLDGNGTSATATGLTEAGFVAKYGKTPINGAPLSLDFSDLFFGVESELQFDIYSYFVGTGDGTSFPLPDLSGSRGGNRVQYIPGIISASGQTSASLSPPTNISLSSGTTELLLQSDGTLVPRIKVTWTPSQDARTLAYEIQFKPSTETLWQTAATALGQSTAASYIVGVVDGVDHDVQIRSVGALREVSDWVTITDYTVIGKTALPSNVGALTFVDPFLSWPTVLDNDLRGYIVRYQPGANTNWFSAIPAHTAGFITEARFDTGDIVGGIVTLLVKAVDTTEHESSVVSSLLVDLRPKTPTSFSLSRQPDGTREYSWSTFEAPADLDGVHIRYAIGPESNWDAMIALHNGVLKASPFESNQLAAGTYTVAAKNVDRAGNESANAIFVTNVTIGDPRIAGAIEDIREEPSWLGTKIDCHIN